MIIHQTGRLTLESWALEDFDDLAVLARDPNVMRFIAQGHPWPDARIGWFMGLQRAYQDTLGYCQWKLVERNSGRFVGLCGLAPLDGSDAPEIGWWLAPDCWGRGIAYEAARHVLAKAASEYALKDIVARSYQENVKSCNLLKRLGFVVTHTKPKKHVGVVQMFARPTD